MSTQFLAWKFQLRSMNKLSHLKGEDVHQNTGHNKTDKRPMLHIRQRP